MTDQQPPEPVNPHPASNPPGQPTDPTLPMVPYGGSPPPPSGYGPPPTVYGHPGYPQPPMRVAPKSPGLALLASFFIPGLGSLINGDIAKGIAIFVGHAFSWLIVLTLFWLVVPLVFLLGVAGFWVWGMVDAYTGAQKWNLRHGIIS